MATQEKLLKSLETLKSLLKSKQEADVSFKKKDKMTNAKMIVDGIGNPAIKMAPNFSYLLSFSIEVLLQLCDDPDSDVRMTAEECLNRLIKAVDKSHMSKIQFELHKEIKISGSARTLRAAFWRFAELAQQIRPQKGKAYVTNLMPCLIEIARRDEELLHETLANKLPKIMKALGCFTSDNDIKTLLETFVNNLQNPSAVIRRSASSCILTVCLNCRKSFVFLTYVLNNILDLLIPIHNSNTTPLVLGVLGCLKTILPHIKNPDSEHELKGSFGIKTEVSETVSATDKLLQVYELCLHYLVGNDHNIINASLETLNVILQNLNGELKSVLLSPRGVGVNRIFANDAVTKVKQKYPSQLSVATSLSNEDNLESDLMDSVRPDIQKWIDESKLSVMNITYAKTSGNLSSDTLLQNSDTPDACDYSNIGTDTATEYSESINQGKSISENLNKLHISDTSSEKSIAQLTEDESLAIGSEVLYQDVDIGEFVSTDVSLLYCSRLLVKSFLLTGTAGGTIPDKAVRVSVKSLVLSCLATIFEIYPNALVAYLDKNCSEKEVENRHFCSRQQLSDIFLYSNHSDPQLRGAIRIVISSFIKSVLIRSSGDYDLWIEKNVMLDDRLVFNISNLVNMIVTGLEDESSNSIRQSLHGLDICLNYLLESVQSVYTKNILSSLPGIAVNPYWLIKVKLLEIIGNLEYLNIYYILGSNEFQDKMIAVLFQLIGDRDQRVRSACSSCFSSIVQKLYYKQHNPNESCITSKAKMYQHLYFSSLLYTNVEDNKSDFRDCPGFFTYKDSILKYFSEQSLSRMILKLTKLLMTSTSKYTTHGCLEVLSNLSASYPPLTYYKTWGCFSTLNLPKHSGQKTAEQDFYINSSAGLFSTCIHLLRNGSIGHDLNCHLHILKLVGNLFMGIAVRNLKPQVDLTLEETHQLWDMFVDKNLSLLTEQFLNHILKVLNIFCYVVEELAPTLSQGKSPIQNLPASSTLSPIKRRKSSVGEKGKSVPIHKSNDRDERSDKFEFQKGNFMKSSHYLKLYDVLKSAYVNYKTSLESESCEFFIEFLRTTLVSLSQILEFATLLESGRIAEEVLHYFLTTFRLEPSGVIQCVQQLLKSLFGTNLTCNPPDSLLLPETQNIDIEQNESLFYYAIFQKSYNEIALFINNFNSSKTDKSGDATVMGYLYKKHIRKACVLPKGGDKILANYIKLFEPMVIESLKQYTITNNVQLQCSVLQLLCQLVQLKVNYCLLDSEQIFIGFVLKQFEFIEHGQLSLPQDLIPKIFDFLVQLSYSSKQHSKSMFDVPKILQLCDGLMASGQPPLTHCIPALQPVVEDVFVHRNRSATTDKELETTKEVVLSMLLRLLEYYEVLDLLVLILNESKFNEDKWRRWSNTILDHFLPLLKENKIRLNSEQGLIAVIRLFFALNPCVFKNLTKVLHILFDVPPSKESNSVVTTRWFAKIIAVLLVTLRMKEDLLFLEIREARTGFSTESIFNSIDVITDPLNVMNTIEFFNKIPPDVIFIRLIFRIIHFISEYCILNLYFYEDVFIIKLFSNYLMICLHMLQSGTHCKLANTALELVKNESNVKLNEINNNFLQLGAFYPILTFKWCYILTLLNYNDLKFWSRVMRVNEMPRNVQSNSLNLDVVRVGATIVFCDYLAENVHEKDLHKWILKNITLLVELCDEEPVSELFSSLHRDSTMSNLVLQAISKDCLPIIKSSFKVKMLKSVENVHPTQIGALLFFLLPKFLDCRQLALCRMASNLASRKTELLLTMTMEEVNGQLSRTDLIKVINSLIDLGLHKKHETLISLLNKLATQYYDLSPLEFYQRRTVNPEYIKKLVVNKSWYMSQIKSKCQNIHVGPEVSQLLHQLEFEDILSIISDKQFDTTLLFECISLGISEIKKGHSYQEPCLLKAAITVLMEHVKEVRNLFPKPHQVYSVKDRKETPSETKYFNALTELFDTQQFWLHWSDLISCVTLFIESLPALPTVNIPDGSIEDLIRFAVVCLESLNYLLDTSRTTININYVDMTITCAEIILKEIHLCGILALDSHVSWLCSAINSIHKFASNLLLDEEPLPYVQKYGLESTLENLETVSPGHACHQLYILMCWLEKTQEDRLLIPRFLLKSIKSIIISLSRFPLVNSYQLTPPSAWKSGLTVQLSGSYNTQVPPLPIEYLKEVDILEEFIYRSTLLGWNNRQQFEETWMCLLSVLCSSPTEDLLSEEINAVTHATSLSVQAITALLLQTMYLPHIGNPNVSTLIHVSRDTPIDTTKNSIKKLKHVQDSLVFKYNSHTKALKNEDTIINVFNKPNLERIVQGYGYGQVSVEYLLSNENCEGFAAQIFKSRQKLLEESGLDVNSCLQFLIDLYSQWLKSQSTPLRILYEVVKSILVISDLFTDKTQFNWMLELFMELARNHTIEDEILHQYIIVGLCKSSAVLTPNIEVYEIIKRNLLVSLKSGFMPARIASLHGLLYLFEGCILGNTHIGGLSEEMQVLLPLAVDYINSNINLSDYVSNRSQEHNVLVWSLAFYLIESIELNHFEAEFIPNIIQAAKVYLSNVKVSVIHSAIFKGLERLALKGKLNKLQLNELIKLALEKLNHGNSKDVIRAVQLLLTCTYTDYGENLDDTSVKEVESNPDTLIQSIERISVMFDYIKRGYPFEVDLICSILPDVLNDFFPPSDILTKVLGEFLSPQQPHPKLLCGVVFKIFECAIEQSQLSLLQDWVVFNLTNFTQSSVGMATWYLTCFFISASTNEWLRALFPYVQSRIGRYDYEDRQLLCIAGADFYRNLTDERQRSAFVETFTKAKHQNEMPYSDLLSSL